MLNWFFRLFAPKSVKQRVVLELLATGQELRGLELVKRSKGRLHRGTVYVLLWEMVEEGLLVDRVLDEEDGARRYTYRVTDKGLQRLSELMVGVR